MSFLRFIILLVALSIMTIATYADDDLNGNSDRRRIEILQPDLSKPPHVADPVAMYTISTATIDITFDANYYSEYTIHLVGEYVEMDYFVYTPVVYIPVATFGEVIDIYIESDDCGCYYGTLDQSAYINTYKTN